MPPSASLIPVFSLENSCGTEKRVQLVQLTFELFYNLETTFYNKETKNIMYIKTTNKTYIFPKTSETISPREEKDYRRNVTNKASQMGAKANTIALL